MQNKKKTNNRLNQHQGCHKTKLIATAKLLCYLEGRGREEEDR